MTGAVVLAGGVRLPKASGRGGLGDVWRPVQKSA